MHKGKIALRRSYSKIRVLRFSLTSRWKKRWMGKASFGRCGSMMMRFNWQRRCERENLSANKLHRGGKILDFISSC